jgi:hypothetical protein
LPIDIFPSGTPARDRRKTRVMMLPSGLGLGLGLGSHSSSHAPLLLATLLSHYPFPSRSLLHTSLGSSYLISHVLHCPPSPPAHSFIIGPAVINTHIHCCKPARLLQRAVRRTPTQQVFFFSCLQGWINFISLPDGLRHLFAKLTLVGEICFPCKYIFRSVLFGLISV